MPISHGRIHNQATHRQGQAQTDGVLGPLHCQHRYFQRIPVSKPQHLIHNTSHNSLILCYRDLVTVPFHQVVRAISPVFTIGIYHVFFGAVYSTQTYVSLIPVMFGVGLATYGDYNATVYGFLMTLAGAILAAVKTVITNRMQTSGLHLSALELLYRMSGPALIQSLIMAWYHGEFDLFGLEHPTMPDPMLCATLIVNGALAFALNYTSFSANKKAGALTMTVAANIKQILTVLFSYLLWDLRVSSLNVCGILLTLAAGAWYSAIELVGKKIEAGDVTRVAEEGSVEKK